MEDDNHLLQLYAKARDEHAFTELVRRRLGLVYGIALRRVGGDAQLAEDVAQKVFTDLARKAATLNDRKSLTGWLYVSTHHASAEAVRSERRRKSREIEAQAMQNLLDESTPEPDLHGLRNTLDEVIVNLRDDEREAIALRFFEERSFADIGATLKLSEDAARKRLDRALEKLRLALYRRGLTCSSLALTAALGELGASTGPAVLVPQIATGALAQAPAVGVGGAFAAWLSPGAMVTGAALVAGGWAVLAQYNANLKLKAELAGKTDQTLVIARLRTENEELMRELRDAGSGPAAWTAAPPQEMSPTPKTAPTQASATATTVCITPEGTILWGPDRITLDDFLTRLRNLNGQARNGESSVLINSDGNFPQLAYVIDEIRKAGISHVKVNRSPVSDPTFKASWF